MMKKTTIEKIGLGAALGMGAGLLLAPKSGKEIRKDIGKKAEEITCKMKKNNKNTSMMKKSIETKIKDIQKQIKDLDKEKVLEEAEKKIKKISESIEDLAEEGKENSNFSNIIDDLKDTMVDASKKLVAKLQK